MPNTKQPDMRYNDSGYNDSTAYEALKNVQKEERRQLICELKELAKSHNVSAGDVLKITRNSKTAGEFISYRIIIEG
mgnify:CR=1 FL=1